MKLPKALKKQFAKQFPQKYTDTIIMEISLKSLFYLISNSFRRNLSIPLAMPSANTSEVVMRGL